VGDVAIVPASMSTKREPEAHLSICETANLEFPGLIFEDLIARGVPQILEIHHSPEISHLNTPIGLRVLER